MFAMSFHLHVQSLSRFFLASLLWQDLADANLMRKAWRGEPEEMNEATPAQHLPIVSPALPPTHQLTNQPRKQ